jgi:hypothetical protein
MDEGSPTADDPSSELQFDLGDDLYEWSTRWAEIEQDREDAPEDALVEAADLLGSMLARLGIPTDPPLAPGTEDVTLAFTEIRDVSRRAGQGERVPVELLDDAHRSAATLFAYLANGQSSADIVT